MCFGPSSHRSQQPGCITPRLVLEDTLCIYKSVIWERRNGGFMVVVRQ